MTGICWTYFAQLVRSTRENEAAARRERAESLLLGAGRTRRRTMGWLRVGASLCVFSAPLAPAKAEAGPSLEATRAPDAGSTVGASPTDSVTSRVAVEVVGELDVEMEAVRDAATGNVTVTGTLIDELGRPVSGGLRILGHSASRACPRPSDPSTIDLRPGRAGGPLVPTNASGAFCIELGEQTVPIRLELALEAEHHASRTVSRPVLVGARAPLPRLVRSPSNVDLDQQSPALFEVLPGDPSAGSEVRLVVLCADMRHEVARANAGAGLVRFEVSPNRLPGPGACVAVVEQSGTSSAEVTRSREQALLLTGPADVKIASVTERAESVRLELRISSQRGAAPVRSGVVEASRLGAFIASAPIEDGRAHLEIERGPEDIDVDVRLVDGGPGVVAGEAASARIPKKAPQPGRHLGEALLLLAFAVWLVHAWLGRKTRTTGNTSIEPTREERADFERGEKRQPISGRVLDAHTGEPCALATVELHASTATARTLIETATTNDGGHFAFGVASDRSPLLTIRVLCPGYTELEARVTGARVTAHLVEARRALLGHLDTQAAKLGLLQGRGKRSPTPREAESMLARRGEHEAAAWASELGLRAFGPVPPTSEQVRRLTRGPVGPENDLARAPLERGTIPGLAAADDPAPARSGHAPIQGVDRTTPETER